LFDDSTSYRRLLARHLNSWGKLYYFFDAEDGIQALKNYQRKKNIGIVISDWEMP
jgi:CheY-like chemotaxis protein